MAVVPAHLRATTTGIAEVCWTGANAVGPMVAGVLSDTLGDPNKSAEQGDHSGLVAMLLIGAAIPLGHAAIAWHWRGSVADEIASQQQVRSATPRSMLWLHCGNVLMLNLVQMLASRIECCGCARGGSPSCRCSHVCVVAMFHRSRWFSPVSVLPFVCCGV